MVGVVQCTIRISHLKGDRAQLMAIKTIIITSSIHLNSSIVATQKVSPQAVTITALSVEQAVTVAIVVGSTPKIYRTKPPKSSSSSSSDF